MVWDPLIDNLFFSTPHIVLVRQALLEFVSLIFTDSLIRKEISPLGCSIRDRHDGVLRYNNGITVFDLSLHESSIESLNIKSGIDKWETDFLKLAHGLSGVLSHLAAFVDHDQSVVEKLEVVGFLTSGECFYNSTTHIL